ncbi:MAG TPA: MFS transporter [Terriglobales bacterium]|nr:MFS transporter [Terriglobales bacterium]
MEASTDQIAAGRAAFGNPNFVHFLVARAFIILALEMLSVAVGWQVYEITHRPLDLGLVGLAQFLPGVLLFLVSGHAVDHFNRRNVLSLCYAGFVVCSSLLLAITWRDLHSIRPIYEVLVLLGVVRAFNGPVGQAILPQLVPVEHYPNAVAWSASTRTMATILGPSLGGLIYAFSRGPSTVYAAVIVASGAAFVTTLQIKTESNVRVREPVSLTSVMAGLDYIWNQKLILGAISLDLFAVLLGGAVALLPVYAREILQTGPWGLGLLRSAPGVGAAAMAALLAYRPLRRKAGPAMLWSVAGFGIFTIIFGISHNLILSLISLLFVGATDMVSVIIRTTLVQLATKDEMRGRVSAVNMLFVGASNEFGQFESGVTAAWVGTVPAVVLGGIGTLIVIGIWAWKFPELRQADKLTIQSILEE